MRVHLQAALALSYALASSFVLPIKRSAVEPYVPYTTSCPARSLIRTAASLNPDEAAYVKQRIPKASQALSTWLNEALGGSYNENLPTLALALSGGGTKAGLTSAGAVYGLDGREDSESPVAGLLQSMTYISALSGGTSTLSGMIQNDFAEISTLRRELYDTSYQNVLAAALNNAAQIRADVGNKTAAGYPTTLIDIYGRAIAFNFIDGPPGGANNETWSSVTRLSSFQNHDVPFPIMTITQSDVPSECEPRSDGAIWEISPLEFGSWDDMVGAFYPTEYMGTTPSNTLGQCTAGFDNTGFIAAISSNILTSGAFCSTGNYTTNELSQFAGLVNTVNSGIAEANPYGVIPNPFYQSQEVGIVRNQEELFGNDGGISGQVIPIFPWIQPERDIDVIIAVDTETSNSTNITDGSSIYATYLSAQENGLKKMPVVPTVEQFAAQDLSSRAQFYGCHDPDVATIIFLPNSELGFENSASFQYTVALINRTFDGGEAMVTQSQSGDEQWPACLACGILQKSGTKLPDVCSSCLETYCWPRQTSGGTGTSCPVDGAVVCNGSNSFGLCNFGTVVFQPVSAGSECKNGKIVSTGGTSCPVDGAVVCNGSSEFGLCNFGSVVFHPVAAGMKCEAGAVVAA